MRRNETNKGITLIALVITIIVLLILAGVSIATLTGENSILSKAQKAKFKTDVAKYKEQIALNSFILEEDNSISGLKKQLELQKGALENGSQNCENALAFMEVNLNMGELSDILGRIEYLLFQLSNEESSTNREKRIKEIDDLILEYDRIVKDTQIDGKEIWNGSINEENPYILDFGSDYFQQGKMIITIEDLSWDKLHGTREIDYNKIEDEIEKVQEAEHKIFNQESVLGAKYDASIYTDVWLSNQETNLEKLYQNIFGTNSETVSEEQAIQNAKSWKTTIEFMNIIDYTYVNIDTGLQRIKECIEIIKNNNNTVGEVKSIQLEIEERIKEIDRELTYTQAGKKKLLDGSFPYMEKITLETLGIQAISFGNQQEIASAETKVTEAIQKIADLRAIISKKQTELEPKREQEAEKGCAFEIDNATAKPTVEIEEKDKDKFQIINGELIYIGDNQNEKQWALEMDIQVKK